MPLYEWTPFYSVHVNDFDRQHQRLFVMINDLHEAMETGRGKAVLGVVLAGLVAYALEHFTAEENAMQSTAYPNFPVHREQHQEFMKRISGFLTEYESGNTLISVNVLRYLNTWLQTHILRSDQAYSSHMNEHGIF